MSLIERDSLELDRIVQSEADLLPSVIMMPEAFVEDGVVTKDGVNTITGYNLNDAPPFTVDERSFDTRLQDLEAFARSAYPPEEEPATEHRLRTTGMLIGMLSDAKLIPAVEIDIEELRQA